MFKWIEKKDLIYWLLFVVMIWLLTSNYDVTLSKWSFAGTIISIILAVIAIIYSFDQSSTTLYSTRKLEESSQKIETVTQLLEKTSINKLFSNLEARIESLNQSFDENIKTNLIVHQKNMENILKNNITNVKIGNDIQILSKEQWKEFLIGSLTDSVNKTSMTTVCLIYCYLVFIKGKELNFNRLGIHVNSKINHTDSTFASTFEKTLEGVFDGSFMAFTSLNVFQSSSTDYRKITSLSEPFNEAMRTILNELAQKEVIRELSDFVENH